MAFLNFLFTKNYLSEKKREFVTFAKSFIIFVNNSIAFAEDSIFFVKDFNTTFSKDLIAFENNFNIRDSVIFIKKSNISKKEIKNEV